MPRSEVEMKNRAIVSVDPFAIDAGGVTDRLEHDEIAHAALMQSIRKHGQQVPILVRPHPETKGRFQIVYGRRRVLALRDLGLPVRAMVRDLDDHALVIAQGQENTARKDLSFVERANFARQMTEAGYDRKAIADALSIDKTVISRMLSIVAKLPIEVIEMVGSAPAIGRDRWVELADLWDANEPDPETARDMIAVHLPDNSDQRFEALYFWLSGRKTACRRGDGTNKQPIVTGDGRTIGQVARGKSRLTILMNRRSARGFEEWLAENLTDLHRAWRESQDSQMCLLPPGNGSARSLHDAPHHASAS